MARRKQSSGLWSRNFGDRGRNWVRVFEKYRGGPLYAEFMEEGKRRCLTLKSRDREEAVRRAEELAAAFGRPTRAPLVDEITIGALFDKYLKEVTPQKSEATQDHDRRRASLWLEVIPPSRLAVSLTGHDAETYVAWRTQKGDLRRGKGGRRLATPLRPRSWRSDLSLLRSVLRWGHERGALSRIPGIVSYSDRTKATVQRPTVAHDSLEALQVAAAKVSVYCHALFVLAHETGHRIGAIRQLRWSDVDLTSRQIHWRAEHDKVGNDDTLPFPEEVAEYLRWLRGHDGAIGDTYIFPSPKSPGRPVSRDLVTKWWRRIERRAGLPRVKQLGWHGLRRKFANDHKWLPVKDLARLGGWTDESTPVRHYLRGDDETIRKAVEGRTTSMHIRTAEVIAEAGKMPAKKKRPHLAAKQSRTAS